MASKSDESEAENQERRVRDILYNEPEIDELQEKFGITDDAKKAAVLIFRVLTGLGKGLSSSKKRSYSAISTWIGAKIVDENRILKEELADAVGLSPRTLSRRFGEIEKDEECSEMMDYMERRIKTWSRKKERRIQDIL